MLLFKILILNFFNCSGYIPPEYALHGFFSVKSDVYSFGVLVLEIVSGKKNRGYSQDEYNHTLIGHVSFGSWVFFVKMGHT